MARRLPVDEEVSLVVYRSSEDQSLHIKSHLACPADYTLFPALETPSVLVRTSSTHCDGYGLDERIATIPSCTASKSRHVALLAMAASRTGKAIPLPDRSEFPPTDLLSSLLGPNWEANTQQDIEEKLFKLLTQTASRDAKQEASSRSLHLGNFRLALTNDTCTVNLEDLLPKQVCENWNVHGGGSCPSMAIQAVHQRDGNFPSDTEVWLEAMLTGANVVAMCFHGNKFSAGRATIHNRSEFLKDAFSAREVLTRGVKFLDFLHNTCEPGNHYWLIKQRDASHAILWDVACSSPKRRSSVPTISDKLPIPEALVDPISTAICVAENCLALASEIARLRKSGDTSTNNIPSDGQVEAAGNHLIERGLRSIAGHFGTRARTLTSALKAASVEFELDKLARILLSAPEESSKQNLESKGPSDGNCKNSKKVATIFDSSTNFDYEVDRLEKAVDSLCKASRRLNAVIDDGSVNKVASWGAWTIETRLRLDSLAFELGGQLRSRVVPKFIGQALECNIECKASRTAAVEGMHLLMVTRILNFARLYSRLLSTQELPLSPQQRIGSVHSLVSDGFRFGFFVESASSLIEISEFSNTFGQLRDPRWISRLLYTYFPNSPAPDRDRLGNIFDKLQDEAHILPIIGESLQREFGNTQGSFRDGVWRLCVRHVFKCLPVILDSESPQRVATILHRTAVIEHEWASEGLMTESQKWLHRGEGALCERIVALTKVNRALLRPARLITALYCCAASATDPSAQVHMAVILLHLARAFQLLSCCNHSGDFTMRNADAGDEAAELNNSRSRFSEVQYKCYMAGIKCCKIGLSCMASVSPLSRAAIQIARQYAFEGCLSLLPVGGDLDPRATTSSIEEANVKEALPRILATRRGYINLAAGADIAQYLSYQENLLKSSRNSFSPRPTTISDSRASGETGIGGMLIAEARKRNKVTEYESACDKFLGRLLNESLHVVSDFEHGDSVALEQSFLALSNKLSSILQQQTFGESQPSALVDLALTRLHRAVDIFMDVDNRKEFAVAHFYIGKIHASSNTTILTPSAKRSKLARKHLRVAMTEFDPWTCPRDFLKTVISTLQLPVLNAEDLKSSLGLSLAAELTMAAVTPNWPGEATSMHELRFWSQKLSLNLLRQFSRNVVGIDKPPTAVRSIVIDRGFTVEQIELHCHKWVTQQPACSIKELYRCLLRGEEFSKLLNAHVKPLQAVYSSAHVQATVE